jgi:hypothetical protein
MLLVAMLPVATPLAARSFIINREKELLKYE